MSNVAKIESSAPVVADYGTSLLEVISRAASDPNVDIDKLERLLAAQERVSSHQAERTFNEAMNAAQTQMPQIVKDGTNDTTRSKYSKLETISALMSPVISRNGFSLSYGTAESPLVNHYRITCRLSHVGGHSRDYHVDIPIDNEGMKGTKNKTDTHGAVSAITYGRRILKLMIFDVATRDDDGNGAAGIHPISVDQYDALKKKINDTQADEEKFCAWLGVAELKDLHSHRFVEAIRALEKKGGK